MTMAKLPCFAPPPMITVWPYEKLFIKEASRAMITSRNLLALCVSNQWTCSFPDDWPHGAMQHLKLTICDNVRFIFLIISLSLVQVQFTFLVLFFKDTTRFWWRFWIPAAAALCDNIQPPQGFSIRNKWLRFFVSSVLIQKLFQSEFSPWTPYTEYPTFDEFGFHLMECPCSLHILNCASFYDTTWLSPDFWIYLFGCLNQGRDHVTPSIISYFVPSFYQVCNFRFCIQSSESRQVGFFSSQSRAKHILERFIRHCSNLKQIENYCQRKAWPSVWPSGCFWVQF